jgi:predicted nuclease of predicted toxin-antitoxin system
MHARGRDWDVEGICEEILRFSLQQNASVITLDADFHAILAVSGSGGQSVIRVRRQGLDAAAIVELIDKTLAGYVVELMAGRLITVKVNKTTCHMLPIGVR